MSPSLEASALAHIRRESLDIYNRLRSIEADIIFVNQVGAAYPAFPLIRTASTSLHFEFPYNKFYDSEPPLWGLVLRSYYRTFSLLYVTFRT
jgi:tRNA A64-2'-O-ribosylphosphate transferase